MAPDPMSEQQVERWIALRCGRCHRLSDGPLDTACRCTGDEPGSSFESVEVVPASLLQKAERQRDEARAEALVVASDLVAEKTRELKRRVESLERDQGELLHVIEDRNQHIDRLERGLYEITQIKNERDSEGAVSLIAEGKMRELAHRLLVDPSPSSELEELRD